MDETLKKLEDKIKPKYLIYLYDDNFEYYKDKISEKIYIQKTLLKERLLEVLEIDEIPGDKIYKIGINGKKLGWIKIDSPLLIMNTLNEYVFLKNQEHDTELNDLLGMQPEVTTGFLKSRYVTYFNNTLYIGLENNKEFIGFYNNTEIDYGSIEPHPIKFKNEVIDLYYSYSLKNSRVFYPDKTEYYMTKYYEDVGIGRLKIDGKYFWFNLSDVDLDTKKISKVKKDEESFYLEHLIRSISIDKSIKPKKDKIKIDNEKANILEKQLQKKNSRIEYFERLTENNNRKMNYYTERNEKLEQRIQFLENKVAQLDKSNRALKNSKVIRLYSKLFDR